MKHILASGLESIPQFPAVSLAMTVGMVFVFASVSKLRNPATLQTGLLGQASWIPQTVRRVIAIGLPCVELVVGLLFMISIHPLWVGLVILGLLGLFTIVVGAYFAAGKQVRCSCFGEGGEEETKPGLFLSRNASLMALTVMALHSEVSRLTGSELCLAVLVAWVLIGCYSVIASHSALRKNASETR